MDGLIAQDDGLLQQKWQESEAKIQDLEMKRAELERDLQAAILACASGNGSQELLTINELGTDTFSDVLLCF